MNAWWSPPSKKDIDDKDRLEVLAALKGVETATRLARTGSCEWANEGRAVWAMRQLQALNGAEEELRKVRVHLCIAARGSELSLREIAEVAGTTHPTVQKWSQSPAPFLQGSPAGSAERPPWILTNDDLLQVAKDAGISEDIATSLIEDAKPSTEGGGGNASSQ